MILDPESRFIGVFHWISLSLHWGQFGLFNVGLFLALCENIYSENFWKVYCVSKIKYYLDSIRFITWHNQGWGQKLSDRGAGVSNRGLKWLKNAVFVRYFAKFPPTRTQNFLQRGARCLQWGGCSPPSPPLAPPLGTTYQIIGSIFSSSISVNIGFFKHSRLFKSFQNRCRMGHTCAYIDPVTDLYQKAQPKPRRVPAPRPVAGAWPGQAGATGRGISRTFPFILPTPASPGHLQVYLWSNLPQLLNSAYLWEVKSLHIL